MDWVAASKMGIDPEISRFMKLAVKAFGKRFDLTKLENPYRKLEKEDPDQFRELVDNLNASMHLRAVLTDLFLISEASRISGS